MHSGGVDAVERKRHITHCRLMRGKTCCALICVCVLPSSCSHSPVQETAMDGCTQFTVSMPAPGAVLGCRPKLFCAPHLYHLCHPPLHTQYKHSHMRKFYCNKKAAPLIVGEYNTKPSHMRVLFCGPWFASDKRPTNTSERFWLPHACVSQGMASYRLFRYVTVHRDDPYPRVPVSLAVVQGERDQQTALSTTIPARNTRQPAT